VQLVFPFQVKRSVVVSAGVVTLSAIAHSLVLWVPLPETETETPSPSANSETATEEISVVMLPDQESLAPSAEASPSPPPPSPRAAARPPAEATTLLPTDVISEPVAPEVESPPVPPTSPAPPAEPAPPAVEELPVDETSTPAFTAPSSDGPLMGYSDGFPHVAGAVGGCFGLSECRQVSDAGNYRSVARSLIDGLEAQGYAVRLRDDLEDTGRNVYELTPPNGNDTPQFLMVFSGLDGSAIYVMGPEVMTLDDLKSLSAQQVNRNLPPV